MDKEEKRANNEQIKQQKIEAKNKNIIKNTL